MLGVLAALACPFAADVPFASGLAVAVLVPAALIDVQTRRLPDTWVVGAAAAFLLADAIARTVGTVDSTPSDVALGVLCMAAPLFLLHLLSPDAMGFGDVKVAVVLGAALGAADWHLALPALALAAGLTATYGLVRQQRHVAFGPGLVGGTLLALLAHDLLVRT